MENETYLNLKKYFVNVSCPICKNNKWTLDPQARCMVTIDDTNSIKLGGSIQPMIIVNCDQCGYSLMFNTLILNKGDKNNG